MHSHAIEANRCSNGLCVRTWQVNRPAEQGARTFWSSTMHCSTWTACTCHGNTTFSETAQPRPAATWRGRLVCKTVAFDAHGAAWFRRLVWCVNTLFSNRNAVLFLPWNLHAGVVVRARIGSCTSVRHGVNGHALDDSRMATWREHNAARLIRARELCA